MNTCVCDDVWDSFSARKKQNRKIMRGKIEERIKISLNEYCKHKINSMTDSTVHPLSYSLQYDLDHKDCVYDVKMRASHWQQIYTTNT